MILKAILCVQHFCSFGAMLFIVDLLIKTDFTVICVPCMLVSNFVCPEFLQFWCNVIHRRSAYKNGFYCYLCSLYA